jgi:oxygen-dependent protoporphyrinogen oxidase
MIAVIGGGISGLAAAYELKLRGVEFQLLEASQRAGGLIQTEEYERFLIDAGPDSMLATKPAGRMLCEAVGLGPTLVQMMEPRTAFVLDRNRLYPLPSPAVLGIPLTPGAAMGFRLLPLHSRVRVLLEPYVRPRAGGDESVAAFFRRRFGAATVERVAQPLLGGIHAGDVEQLSVQSLFPALRDAEVRGGLLRSFAPRQPVSGSAFNSPASGMETLPNAVVRALPADAIHFGTEVRAVAPTSDGWRLDTTTGVRYAAGVVLATPMPVTAKLLAGVDADAARFCARVPHASTVSIALAWHRDEVPHPLEGSGFVVARDRSRITASTWISSKWLGRAPQDYTLLRAFVGGVRDPRAVDLSDDELVAVATRDLGRVLGIRAAPHFARIYRWRESSPQLTVGHAERAREIDRRLESHPGLFAAARGLRVVGIPDCIADARRVAAAAAQYVMRSNRESNTEKYRQG